jgi:hypothetical protein
MYNYVLSGLADLPTAHKATFIFADIADLTKLSVDPNVTMQISTFDEDLPVIVVVPDSELVPMYEHALGPNTYILVMEGSRLSNWQHLFTYLIEERKYNSALFVEWYTLLSNAKTGVLYNMRKNPNYFWDGVTENLDYSDWYATMEQTMLDNNLCSIGVDRRHATDLVTLMNASDDYHYPIQLVMYDFQALRNLKVSKTPAGSATNPIVRDTLIDLAIKDAGGSSDTVPLFTINTPSVTYTEEDLHAIIALPDRYPSVFRRLNGKDIRPRK